MANGALALLLREDLRALSHSKKVRDAFQAYYYVINFSKRHTPYDKKCANC